MHCNMIPQPVIAGPGFIRIPSPELQTHVERSTAHTFLDEDFVPRRLQQQQQQ